MPDLRRQGNGSERARVDERGSEVRNPSAWGQFFDPESSLIVVPVFAFTLFVAVATWAAVHFTGALLGLLVWLPIWVIVMYRLFSTTSQYTAALNRPHGHRDEVLLVANGALASEGLVNEVGRIGRSLHSKVFVSVPVPAPRWIDKLTNDLDDDLKVSEDRQQAFLSQIESRGVEAEVREDVGAGPLRALIDGLAECSADEIILAPSEGEPGWKEAESLAAKVSQRYGIPIVCIGDTVPLAPADHDGSSLDQRLEETFPASDPPGTY